jgi:2'-5' RNA ligase
MRLFVAIELDGSVIARLCSIQEKLRSGDFGLKLVEPENLHFTLKFLGDVQESQLVNVEKAVSEAADGKSPFTLSLHGIGHFGGSRVGVIWAGVKEGRVEFIGLANELEKRLCFIRKDERGPSPHLTIARVKSGRNADLLLRELGSLRDVKIGEVRVKEIRLKQSVLTPQGPVYSDVKTFPLKEKVDEDG